jgi:hypothetical protein
VNRPNDRVGLGRQEAEKVIPRFAFPDVPNRRPPRPDAGEKGERAAIVDREPYRRTGAVRQNLVLSEAGKGDDAAIAARKLEDGFAKSLAFSKIAPRLPNAQRVEILGEAFAAAGAIDVAAKRISAMIELSSGLEGLSLSALYALWRRTLHILARRSRVDLLFDLWASQGFLHRLGGSEAETGIIRGVYAVGQWWP